ncbi:uncharacterized protein LOC144010548 isoform X2 [Festucalex cinctus]
MWMLGLRFNERFGFRRRDNRRQVRPIWVASQVPRSGHVACNKMATDSTASFSAMLPPEEQCSGKDEHLQSGRSCGPPFQEASAGRSPLRRCHQHRPQGSGKTHEGLSQQSGRTRGPGPSCTHWRTSEMCRSKKKKSQAEEQNVRLRYSGGNYCMTTYSYASFPKSLCSCQLPGNQSR